MSRRLTPSKRDPVAGKLTAEEIVRRLNAHQEPPGHPQSTVFCKRPDPRQIRRLKMMFESAGVLPYLERRLRRSGPASRLTVSTLLIAKFYVIGEWATYWRTHVANFLASLEPQDAVDLGVQPLDTLLKPVSYDVVAKQSGRLEKALHDGWTDEDGTRCDLRWFTVAVIRASVPPRIARMVENVAMDATDVSSWANGKRPDGHGGHGLDPDATHGHCSGNSEREPGGFYGYMLTTCIAVRPWHLTRSTKRVKFGPAVPPYVVSLIFETATANVAKTGIDAMEDALHLCPNISKLVVDRGYSQLGPSFNRPIHTRNIDIAMDYKEPTRTSVKPVRLGPSGYPAFLHAGTFLHACTPPNWRKPPPGLKDKELQDFYTERARRFALNVHKHLDGGAKQLSSPTRDGRLNIDPDQHTGPKGRPLHPPPADLTRIFKDLPQELLHQGLITAVVENLDYFQWPPWGTPLHDQVYGQRNPSENIFSQIKDENGLSKKVNRIMGSAARHIMCLARCVSYNLKLTRKGEEELKAQKQARRAANKSRPATGTQQQLNGTDQPASTPTAGEAPDSPARPPP